MKAYQAYGANCCVTALTAKAAGIKFFDTYPNKRKCDIVEGDADGIFFVVTYGLRANGAWPERFKNITKKTLADI